MSCCSESSVQEQPAITMARVLIVNDLYAKERRYKEIATRALESLNIRREVRSFYSENEAKLLFTKAIIGDRPFQIVLMEYREEIHPAFIKLLREESLRWGKPVSFICVIDGGQNNPLSPRRGDKDQNLDSAVQWCVKPVTEEKLIGLFKVCLGIVKK